MVIKILCVVFAMLLLLPASANKTENTKMLKPNTARRTKTTEIERKKIESFILTVKPGSPKFAQRLSKYIVASAKQNKINPYIVATTGYVESEFKMVPSPCVGIMQINSKSNKDGLNPYKVRDNIEIGSRKLSYHYYNNRALASRGGNYRLRYMWGRYNGCGTNSSNSYIQKVIRVHSRLQSETPPQWKTRLEKQHTLWKK